MGLAHVSALPGPDKSDRRYEAPAIVVLGDVVELTLGGEPGESGDGSATYAPDFVSDLRLKEQIQGFPAALARLRQLGN
jgi:hypothetical protein